MTSSHHAPYVQGFTHATMAGTKGCDPVRGSESQKAGLSSDWGLQLDPMKSESLVIADQQRCGEYVPGPCTHRPSRHESRQHPKPMAQPPCVGGGRVGGGGRLLGFWGIRPVSAASPWPPSCGGGRGGVVGGVWLLGARPCWWPPVGGWRWGVGLLFEIWIVDASIEFFSL